jgi:glutaryl-CoA dehydrogenase
VIWARDVEDGQVKGFVVEKDTPGFSTSKLEDKMALRVVQNALITLDDVRVPERTGCSRRQLVQGHREGAVDDARRGRLDVGRLRAGRLPSTRSPTRASGSSSADRSPPSSSCRTCWSACSPTPPRSAMLCARLSQLQDAGVAYDEHASLAKMFCTMRMRETVGYARELLGGNGILLEHNVGRYVADAEAIYSYEGTAR